MGLVRSKHGSWDIQTQLKINPQSSNLSLCHVFLIALTSKEQP